MPVRNVLYKAALSACRYNPALKTFHNRLAAEAEAQEAGAGEVINYKADAVSDRVRKIIGGRARRIVRTGSCAAQ